MMKMNALMARRWARVGGGIRRAPPLAHSLAVLAAGPLVVEDGSVVLKALRVPQLQSLTEDDLTGFEALTNKIHIADYVDSGVQGDLLLLQGVKYAEALAARLTRLGRPVRIFLSRDPDADEVIVRFFVRRPKQPWGTEDLEKYQLEEVMQWDVGSSSPATPGST